jgi:hypothetical protein
MKETVDIVHSDRLVDATFYHSTAVKSLHVAIDVHPRIEEIFHIANHNPIEQQRI